MKKKGFHFYWEEGNKKSPEISIDLPDFSKDEISVSIENGFINVAAEKKVSRKEKGKGFYREEAFQCSFRRSMLLPDNVNPDDLEIKVEDGSVKIRKKKKALQR